MVGREAAVGLCCAVIVLGCESDPEHPGECLNCGGVDPPPTSEPVDAIDFDALFVVNGGDATISVIDTGSNEVRSTITLTRALFPHHLNLSADGSEMAL